MGTCKSIKQKVVAHNLNYRNLFYQPLPNGVFSARESAVIKRLADVCAQLAEWTADETLADRVAELIGLASTFGDQIQAAIADTFADLPNTLAIKEF